MKKVRRILSVLLMISILVGMLSIGTAAAEKNSSIQIIEQGGKQYYLSDPAEGEIAGANNFDVWTSKTIAGTENEDEFEVTLQVGTTMKAIPNDVAVVLVMDVSGSMMNDETGERWYDNNMPEGRKRRIEYTREAARAFAEAYVKNAGGAERMLSIVQFGNQAQTVLPWMNANDNGVLKQEVAAAVDRVQVNFTVDPARNNWDEKQALADFGQVDYWDTNEASAEMKDCFADQFQSYSQAATMTDYFRTYMETVGGIERCTYSACEETEPHSHCAFEGCTVSEAHKHCAVEGCVYTEDHFHCAACSDISDHKHCAWENCENAEPHMHCAYEGCVSTEAHTHCQRCGLTTSDHTHIVGCTLSGCLTPYEGPHTHCCVRGGDSIDRYYCRYSKGWGSYGYRCKDPNPEHTHEFLDSDTAYLTGSRYFGSVWAIGTNMEAGLLLARNLVADGLRENGAIEGIDNVYVILLSDGKPTWMTDETSTTELKAIGKANNYGTWPALKDIVVDGSEDDIAIAEDIKEMAKLYAILYSNDLESKFSIGADHPLTGVSGAEWLTKSGDYYVGADAVFDSPAADGLDTAFLQINDRIDVLAKAWIVSDTLSEDVSFIEFLQNGSYAAFTPGSESTEATVSWSLGGMEPESGSGTMQHPYIYTLKYKVRLNSAQDDVKAASLAHDADNTLDGVWTGNNTNLQYFMIEKDKLDTMKPEDIQKALRGAAFEDVSVKGLYGDYTFVKKNGETEEPMEDVGFTLHAADETIYGSEIRSDAEGTAAFTDVPRGTYKLKETTVPEGMQQMADLELQVSWGEFLLADGQPAPEAILNWAIGTEPDDPDDPFIPDLPERPETPDLPTEPNDTPVVELPDEEVPATETPVEETTEDLVELPDEDVPLYDSPPTGDHTSAIWVFLMAASAVGVLACSMAMLGRRKQKER